MSPKPAKRPEVACPSCGAPNGIGRPFCASCGGRMFGDKKNLPKVAKKVKGGSARALRSGLISLLVAALVVGGLLACWPYSPSGESGNSASAPSMHALVGAMDRAITEGAGPFARVITESQWNGFVQSRLDRLRDQPGYGRYTHRYPVELRADFEIQHLELVGVERWGPFDLSTRVVMTQAADEKVFHVKSLWRGHLPLPASLTRFMTRGLARRFDLEIPDSLWQSLHLLRADDLRLSVGVLPDAP